MEVSDHGGVRKLIMDFRKKVYQKMKYDKLLSSDCEKHLDEMHEYVMAQLHLEFFKFSKMTQVYELE
jgi:hypothetical protein